MEVAQIAEGIAQKLNAEHSEFHEEPISERLCVTSALIHDLGHPPFGHNGERALDDVMRPYGGFEGNAQTIRIIARVEKKLRKSGAELSETGDRDEDDRVGLALTYRTILSALKYDRLIPHMRGDQEGLVKGYYFTEQQLIERAKSAVDPNWRQRKKFKTLECSIMDIADDIAYSTFDLEDSLKAGFITPAAILATDESVFDTVATKANKALHKDDHIDGKDALAIFIDIFSDIFDKRAAGLEINDTDRFIDCYKRSTYFAEDGYVRTALSSELVGKAIRSVRLNYNQEAPWLSEAYLPPDMLKRIEVLKHFTFESTIFTARVKVGEYRGYEVVKGIFKALSEPKGSLLMPEDLRAMHKQLEHDATARHRAICDFVAGMTDRYALEFYARLYSDEPESIFKPV
ncbi:UNVERIFIED_ORG: dGTPase [Methylorubrum zatmanii]